MGGARGAGCARQVYPGSPRGKRPVVEAGTAAPANTLEAPSMGVRSAAREAGAPVLEPGRGGPAEQLATRLGDPHPVVVFLAALVPGFAVLAGLSIALSLLVTKVLLSVDRIASGDEHFVAWLAAERTPSRVEASWVGSTLAGGVVIPVVIGAVLLGCAAWRRWRIAAFVLFSVAVESAAYRVTTLAVHRERPDVDRLESLPVNASIPSGHTAASIALYCGIALLLTSRLRAAGGRATIWAIALAIPPFVALSRMLRGMHHPLDVAVGAALGVGAVVVVLFAVRAAGAAALHRSRQERTA